MVKITVGMATCGVSAGAAKVFETFRGLVDRDGGKATLHSTGCLGMCYREPLVEIDDGVGKYIYGEVDEKKAKAIFQGHILDGRPVEEHLVLRNFTEGPEQSFLARQVKIVLRNCGYIDPDSIEDYERRDGYGAIRQVLAEMTPEQVIQTMADSGLRGRGGAGFPTGQKWKFGRGAPGDVKYVVCNADEGDPGAFMDRSVLEGDPHSVLEGMMIAAHAIGASHGYIYCRAEYPLAVKRLKHAIVLLREKGYLGKNIFSSSLSFDVKLKEGAGAFVCGEETALIRSIEGERGQPRVRPPYPTDRGLWGHPTVINNVETFANVPAIIQFGAEWFRRIGTTQSGGTKVFALAGKIKNTGLAEVPLGSSLRHIIFDIGGGVPGRKLFKAVQSGGPSGGPSPPSASAVISPIGEAHATCSASQTMRQMQESTSTTSGRGRQCTCRGR